MTDKLKSIIESLNAEVKANSIYVWGGQGERVLSLGAVDLANMETSAENAGRVMKHIKSLLISGKSLKDAKAWDCSGLIGQKLIDAGILKSDTTADGIYQKALKAGKTMSVGKMKAGDLVFKLSGSKATHVGMCTGANGRCVEAMGRDVGVVSRTAGKGSKWDVAIRVTEWYND